MGGYYQRVSKIIIVPYQFPSASFSGLLAATHCCSPASTFFVKLPSGQFSFGQISRGYAV